MPVRDNDTPFSALLVSAMDERSVSSVELLDAIRPLGYKAPNVVNRWRNGRMIPEDKVLPVLVQLLGYDEDAWARSMRTQRRLQQISTQDDLRAEVVALRAELQAARAENDQLRKRQGS